MMSSFSKSHCISHTNYFLNSIRASRQNNYQIQNKIYIPHFQSRGHTSNFLRSIQPHKLYTKHYFGKKCILASKYYRISTFMWLNSNKEKAHMINKYFHLYRSDIHTSCSNIICICYLCQGSSFYHRQGMCRHQSIRGILPEQFGKLCKSLKSPYRIDYRSSNKSLNQILCKFRTIENRVCIIAHYPMQNQLNIEGKLMNLYRRCIQN